jgi:group I intron endonuclease
MANLTISYNWDLYKITNPVGEVYIGRSRNFKARLVSYSTISKTLAGQRRLFLSFSHHGFSTHKVEIIEKIYGTTSEANSKEMFWIRSHMSNCNKWPEMRGLNMTDGGNQNKGTGRIPEAEKREIDLLLSKRISSKIWSEEKNGFTFSEEHKKKISIAKKGKPAHNKGIPNSIEYCVNMSNAKRGKSNKLNSVKRSTPVFRPNTSRKPVLVFTDGLAPRELRSIIATCDYLKIGKGLCMRLLGGFNNGVIFNHKIQFKCH